MVRLSSWQNTMKSHNKYMGLFQDQTDSLSEIKRLAALVNNPARRAEIGSDQWPLAIIAYGLLTANIPQADKNDKEVYQQFLQVCPEERRLHALHQCLMFIKQSKGNAWQMLDIFLKEDSSPSIQLQAAFNIMTLAAPSNEERFPGVQHIVEFIRSSQSSIALGALLSLSDLRFLPYATTLIEKESDQTLQTSIKMLESGPNALSCEWLVQCLEKHSSLHAEIYAILKKMPLKGDSVLDVIVPIPSWQFKADGIQALHSWTLPEYYLRMEARLTPFISKEQMEDLSVAWGHAPKDQI